MAIEQGFVLARFKHPNTEKYPDQFIYEILVDDYVYLVPFIDFGDDIFLKTIIPSRKATKKHKIK